MSKIEIGKNEKGEFAILKVTTSKTMTGCSEQPGLTLDGYEPKETIYVHSDFEPPPKPGKISKEYLSEILSDQESNIKKIKKLLV